MLLPLKKSPNQQVVYQTKNGNALTFWIKREDLLHPHISGNKYRKLRYNVEQAHILGFDTLLTFGGAYSNHIAAMAVAGKEFGFKTLGIIRGDELSNRIDLLQANPTLKLASEYGMNFRFVTREAYRLKEKPDFIKQLQREFGDFYLVPQGGTNQWAVKGCEEILTEEDERFDYIACAIGTGGTISGIINSATKNQKVLGFPALKDDFLADEIQKYVSQTDNWTLIKDYHFGGFAKINAELVAFFNDFYEQTHVPLDPIYTGKMVYGLVDLYKKGFFPAKSSVLIIHTGGLQGIEGMNQKLAQKNKVQIKY